MGHVLIAAIAAAEEQWAQAVEVERRDCIDQCECFLGPDLMRDMEITVHLMGDTYYGTFFWAMHEWRLWRSPGGRWRLAQMALGSDQSLLSIPVGDRNRLLLELADASAGTMEELPQPAEEPLVSLLRAVIREAVDGG